MSMKFGNFGNLYTPPSQRAAPQEPSHYGGSRGPVWQTREDLLTVIAQYRKWYDEGRSDVEISALIKAKYVFPHNPPSQFRRGKR